jgi:4-amino-4-deoxy-L-arabinose transferase-like glycosyltransferase
MPALARRDSLVLGSVLALALAARLLFVLGMPAMPVRSDASGYDAAARRLLLDGSYAYPVGRSLWSDDVVRDQAWPAYLRMPPNAFAMPGYVGFVAGVYRLAGTGPGRFVAVRVAQALIATLTLLLIFWIADSVLGRRAAWIALAFNTVYPPNVWVAQYQLTEALFTFLLAGQVALMVWAARSGRLPAYALLGMVTATAIYVRPVAALVPALLLGLDAYRRATRAPARTPIGRLLSRYAVLGIVAALLMVPWVARNARLYRVFMPTTSASALPPIQGETIVRKLAFPAETIPQLADLAPYGNDDHRFAVETAARIAAGMPPASAADAMAALLEKTRMLGEALTSPFTFFSNPAPVMSSPFLVQAVILLLALVGFWRHRRRAEAVALVGGVPVYFVVVHWMIAMLWSRYLYPAMPFMLVLAAAALVAPPGPPRAETRGKRRRG